MNKERKNMSLKVKLIISYFAMCAMVVLAAGVNFKQLSDIKNGLVSADTIGRNMTIILIISIASIIIAVSAGIYMHRNIILRLSNLKNFAMKLAKYDFTKDIKVTKNDEIGDIGSELNTAQKNIRELISTILNQSCNMSTLSEELSANVEEVSAKLDQVDNSSKDINMTMTETSATAQEIAASS